MEKDQKNLAGVKTRIHGNTRYGYMNKKTPFEIRNFHVF